MYSTSTFYESSSTSRLGKFRTGECHRTRFVNMGQYWCRERVGVFRQQAISRTYVEHDLRYNMVSMGHNDKAIFFTSKSENLKLRLQKHWYMALINFVLQSDLPRTRYQLFINVMVQQWVESFILHSSGIRDQIGYIHYIELLSILRHQVFIAIYRGALLPTNIS